jgi:tRNA/tmRNA/rRNA uracil-C5-methylase (TrmA/RlmC/RlmD family)
VLDIRACPFACEPINSALAGLRASSRFSDLPHEARVTFRHTAHDGALWWTDDRSSGADVPEHLTEASPVGPLLVPYDGFYQVNPAASDRLVRTVAEVFAATPDAPEILDLYCGVGVFGFACLAAGGSRLTGIESGRSAVAAARLNAAALGLTAAFYCHALGQEHVALDRFTPAPRRTTALLDPPRDGLAPGLCQSLAASGIARILYVSCDPATLARDLAILLAGGRYRLLRARLFDLFPRTAHFETLVELART